MEITKEVEEYLRENYLKLPIKKMARHFGHNYKWIERRLDKLGLFIPLEIRKKHLKESYFKKGKKSLNKGKHPKEYMSEESYSKMKKSFFKKGHKPHNSLKLGDEVRRTEKGGKEYIYIKVAERSRLVAKHRYIYEQYFGKIRHGYSVIFLDGNNTNFDIENLKAVSRQELMLLNSANTKHIPKELIPVHAKISEIKYLIKNKSKN